MLYDIELNFDQTQRKMLQTNCDWYFNLAAGVYWSEGMQYGVVRNYFRALTIATMLKDEERLSKINKHPLAKAVKEFINESK